MERVSFGIAILLCGLAASVLWCSNPISEYYYNYLASSDEVELIIAQSWNTTIKLAQKDTRNRFQSVVAGTNGAIDVIVQGTLLLRKLGVTQELESKVKLKERDLINSLDHLTETFSYFFSKGAGGERFMNNKELHTKSVAVAKMMPDAELSVGGNAALIAQALIENAPTNVRVYYGGLVGSELKSLLNPRIIVPPSAKSEHDEYHVIMEYKKGEKWAGHTCPIASRFIFSHDMVNGHMLALEKFVSSFNEIRPDLVVLSGLHMMESQQQSFWNRRFAEIASALSGVKIPIHLELASMADHNFVKVLAERVFPVINSIGLNEQELWMLCLALQGPHCIIDGRPVNLEGPPSPGVAHDIMYWIFEKFSHPKFRNSNFDRIHFHTLTYHTVATVASSKWLHGNSSVAAGARTASTQSCGDRTIQTSKVDVHLSKTFELSAGGLPAGVSLSNNKGLLDYFNPVMSWSMSNVHFNLSPVLVCRSPVKTVGLGDAISSAGLLYSGYRKK